MAIAAVRGLLGEGPQLKGSCIVLLQQVLQKAAKRVSNSMFSSKSTVIVQRLSCYTYVDMEAFSSHTQPTSARITI